jgi:hypothetical protein
LRGKEEQKQVFPAIQEYGNDILYLQQQNSVSRKRQGNAGIGKTFEEHRAKYL